MSATSTNKHPASYRYPRLVALTAFGLFGLIVTPFAHAGESTRGTSISFDQFIDETTGDEVKPKDLEAAKAYRGRRVYKSLFRLIDRQGYYADFIKRFQLWCSSSGGRYVENERLDADCFDGSGDQRSLGAYNVQIVATAKFDGQMTAGYATFYFFQQHELEVIRQANVARDIRAQQAAEQQAVTKQNEEAAMRKQALRNVPLVSAIGQKICKTLPGVTQSTTYYIDGRVVRPDYLLTAFTESAANNKIQLRIAAIRAMLPTGLVNVDRLDGNVTLQANAVVWDDPMLWRPCD